jgi:nicotinate-nucleotide adenylyltransferase
VLRASDPDAELTLILGADQWQGFARWKNPREIQRLAQIAVLTREGDRPSDVAPDFDDGPPPPIMELPVTRLDISSTLVRDRVRAGRSIRFFVPETVRRMIETGGLYR